jgi:hypothetical protein
MSDIPLVVTLDPSGEPGAYENLKSAFTDLCELMQQPLIPPQRPSGGWPPPSGGWPAQRTWHPPEGLGKCLWKVHRAFRGAVRPEDGEIKQGEKSYQSVMQEWSVLRSGSGSHEAYNLFLRGNALNEEAAEKEVNSWVGSIDTHCPAPNALWRLMGSRIKEFCNAVLKALNSKATPLLLWIPSEDQRRVLHELKDKGMTKDCLAEKLDMDSRQLHRDVLSELMKRGKIRNHRRAGGYFRPDAPPPAIKGWLETEQN